MERIGFALEPEKGARIGSAQIGGKSQKKIFNQIPRGAWESGCRLSLTEPL